MKLRGERVSGERVSGERVPQNYFAHESSYIDDGASIGAGTKIWHFCHVMPGAVIGDACNLGQNVVVMAGARLGKNVKVQNNVSIYEGVVLEDDVFCGPSCVFTNVVNPRSHVSRKSEYRPTLVRRGTSIGANATILCGITLGEYSFIGAGAVVRSDVPAFALMVGVPARRVGWMCRCGVRLQLRDGRATCAACGTAYRETEGLLRLIDRPESPG
jgi:UDP-2-acetamido-3-amino-2,3-dideoxy-glucuronate N-acetyltransferase